MDGDLYKNAAKENAERCIERPAFIPLGRSPLLVVLWQPEAPLGLRPKSDLLSRAGMGQHKNTRMQAEPAKRIAVCAVFFVPGNRMTKLLHMDTDLVFAPRFNLHTQIRPAGIFPRNLLVRDGALALAVFCGVDEMLSRLA